MNYCLISFCNLYAIPYANIYIDILSGQKAHCDIVYWDRDDDDRNISKNELISFFPFSKKVDPRGSRIKRYLSYLGAIKHIRRALKAKKYDGVVFLQTHAAIACLDILRRKYRGRYIVDIRDYTLENIGLYRSMEKAIIANSYSTVISSPAYTRFLPQHKYVVSHNFTLIDDKIVEKITNRNKSPVIINICYIGNVRFYDMAEKILSRFGNDTRFRISYMGTGANALAVFCKQQGIDNVTLADKFDPSMTTQFYEGCTLINNLYGNNNKYLDYALSNKLYYAAQFRIPILVCKDTFMEEICTTYNLGFVVDLEAPDAAAQVYKKYRDIDWVENEKGARRFLAKVEAENGVFLEMINAFVKDRKTNDGI